VRRSCTGDDEADEWSEYPICHLTAPRGFPWVGRSKKTPPPSAPVLGLQGKARVQPVKNGTRKRAEDAPGTDIESNRLGQVTAEGPWSLQPSGFPWAVCNKTPVLASRVADNHFRLREEWKEKVRGRRTITLG
jgi:hypothetical protein